MPMKLVFRVVFCALSVCCVHGIALGETVEGRVVAVQDGDTLTLALQDRTITVDLHGIDCPELGQAHGEQAQDFTNEACLGTRVTVNVVHRYGPNHLAGTVRLLSSENLNKRLVEEGLAWWDLGRAPKDSQLEQLETLARSARRGLWADPEPVPPWEYTEGPAVSKKDRGGGAALWSLTLLSVLLACAVVLLAWRLRRLRAAPQAGETAPAGAPAQTVAAPSPSGEDQQFDETREVIQGLLESLNATVAALVEGNTGYVSTLQGHKASIQKAMTVAGVEEIQRLLVGEIEDLETTAKGYREELEQAKTRIHEQESVMAKLREDAYVDGLTRVPNRRALDKRLENELARAKRHERSLSVIMLDIDFFKRVNDAHGHDMGDKVLQVVAHILGECIRDTDFLARYGGEEFAIVLPETSAQQTRVLAERARQGVSKAVLKTDGTQVRVTVSLGIAEFCHDMEDTPEALLKRADDALYRAKDSGRNRVEVAPPPQV
jgi:diguanylate cyclase (GGDEF)-like protein